MRARALLPALLLAVAACGQQTSQYTQYVFNMFAINPAVAGSKDCIDVRMGFRKQWVDFPGAPTTGWATVQGVIKPKGKPYQANRHGVGAFVEADQAGPLGYTSLSLAYAYHIQLNKDYFMSMGLYAGIRQEKLDIGLVTVIDNNDPALATNGGVLVYPDITPGIQLYSKTFWAGLSIQQALGNDMGDLGVESRLARQIMLTAGKRFRIDKQLSVVPSALMKFGPGAPMALDVNVMLEYKRKLGLGFSFRNQDAVAAMVKLPFLRIFTLGYSYDLTTSALRHAGANTHEIILAIYPCAAEDPQKAIVRCPIFE